VITCPCCYATRIDGTAPHGEGQPCPSAERMLEAQLGETQAKTELLHAQRDATILARNR
jgi:hypothetical protein